MEILSRAHAEEAVLGVVCWQIGRGERDLGGVYRRSLSEESIGGGSSDSECILSCLWLHVGACMSGVRHTMRAARGGRSPEL